MAINGHGKHAVSLEERPGERVIGIAWRPAGNGIWPVFLFANLLLQQRALFGSLRSQHRHCVLAVAPDVGKKREVVKANPEARNAVFLFAEETLQHALNVMNPVAQADNGYAGFELEWPGKLRSWDLSS